MLVRLFRVSDRVRWLLAAINLTTAVFLLLGVVLLIKDGLYMPLSSFIISLLLPFLVGLPGVALVVRGKARIVCISMTVVVAVLGTAMLLLR